VKFKNFPKQYKNRSNSIKQSSVRSNRTHKNIEIFDSVR